MFETTELRTGTWTRLGNTAVLGDAVTESALNALAETTLAAARAQGYATGWSQGRHAAEDQAAKEFAEAGRQRAQQDIRREAEHRTAITALENAAEQLLARAAQVCASIETQAVDIAMALTETLVGRELEIAKDAGADAVRRALSLLPGAPLVTLRLNPLDAASAAEVAGVTVVADPSVARGDAIAEADDVVVDATVAHALGRVREVLSTCR